VAETAVAFERVTVRFHLKGTTVSPFRDLSFEIPAGAFWTIIGPSGCGKSTLLRVVADLVPPAEGTARVLGDTPHVARQRRDFGFVFQEATLLPWRTVIANVRLPLEVGGGATRTGQAPTASPEELLKLVGLERWHDALPQQLSGGMRQRVAIARAIATRPRLLLMDEPFGALDELIRDELNDELLRLWAESGMTVLFVTHSLSEAAYLGQKIMVMARGREARILDGSNLGPSVGASTDRRATAAFGTLVQQLREELRGSYEEELVPAA
jgi:NitT/TauT family transport system ATP-binding protein